MLWVSSAWCQCEDMFSLYGCSVQAAEVEAVVLAAVRADVTSGRRSGGP